MKRRGFLGAGIAAVIATACSSPNQKTDDQVHGHQPGERQTNDRKPDAPAMTKIGAVTIVSHPSLDLIYEGIVEGLAELGYDRDKNLTIDLENPQGDQSTLANIANTYASSDNDLFVAIATPPAQALAQVIHDKPIVFASVTDPVAAGLVNSMEKPGGNITGTSDQLPADQQLAKLREVMPNVKSLGIVYSSSEVNAEVQAKAMRKVAEAAGIAVHEATIVNSSEVAQAADSLDVDAYFIGNDNALVSAVESIVQVAERKKALLFTSDADSVHRGAAMSYSTDYKAQGKQTARMIAKIIEGADPAGMPVQIQESLELTVNPKAAERMGVTIAQSIIENAATVV